MEPFNDTYTIKSTNQIAQGITGVLIVPTELDISINPKVIERDGVEVREVRTILIERDSETNYKLSSKVHYFTLDKFADAFEIDPVTEKKIIKRSVLTQMIAPFNLELDTV